MTVMRRRRVIPFTPPAVQGGGGGGAPAFMANLSYRTWTQLAGGSGFSGASWQKGATITNVQTSSSTGLSGENQNSRADAWCGGAADLDLLRSIIVANGGHADYPGNDAYALNWNQAIPGYVRLSDPTPNGQMPQPPSDEGAGIWNDGRPRAGHQCFQQYNDGRVWVPFMNSVSSPGGGSVNKCFSYNLSGLDGITPLAWAAGLGPFTFHDTVSYAALGVGDATALIFGVAAADPVNHRVWGLGGNSANTTCYWSYGTSGGSLGTFTGYNSGQSIGNFAWAVVAPDLNYLFAGDYLRTNVSYLNLASPGSGWGTLTTSGTGYYDQLSGAVYSAASHTIAVSNPKNTGAAIKKLVIPKTGSAFNTGGTGVWSSETLSGPSPADFARPGSNNDGSTKFQYFPDMGGGDGLLVFTPRIDGPAYAAMIASTGI